jgi:hypothetical protein
VRTTLRIDDDVLRAARSIAEAEGRSLGAVISELARRSLNPPGLTAERGFPVFDIRDDAPPITLDDVLRARDDE